MRPRPSIAFVLALTALAGYAAGARPATAQTELLPFRVGSVVTFSFDSAGTRTCRIEELRGAFARCVDPDTPTIIRYGTPEPDAEWVNVAEVELVTVKPARR